jgi:hypothetical protein
MSTQSFNKIPFDFESFQPAAAQLTLQFSHTVFNLFMAHCSCGAAPLFVPAETVPYIHYIYTVLIFSQHSINKFPRIT